MRHRARSMQWKGSHPPSWSWVVAETCVLVSTAPLEGQQRLPPDPGRYGCLPTLGGTLSTQGGLIFIAGTQDFYLRAFNSGNGDEIWKARLPVGSQGGPMTYVSPKTGKQYIVVTAGGARQSTDRGDYVIAYALP